MDAMKLLKGLMGNKSLSSALGSQLLGGLLGGGSQPAQQSQSNPLMGILSGMLGGGGQSQPQGGSSIMSGLLGSVLGGGGGAPSAQPQPASPPPAASNDQAILMIRAMINAAKSDGRIDQQEQENIISKLGDDISQSEIDFLKKEFAAPLDVASFARSVPNGLEVQVYAFSLTSIELDTQTEANYLGQLAQGLNLDPDVCNQVHDRLGAPKIFG